MIRRTARKDRLRERMRKHVRPHQPLERDILRDPGVFRPARADDVDDDDDDAATGTVPQALSARILAEAQAQQREIAMEEEREATHAHAHAHASSSSSSSAAAALAATTTEEEQKKKARLLQLRATREGDAHDYVPEAGDGDAADDNDDDEPLEEIELTAEDEQALSMFVPSALATRQSLGEIIMAKIREKEALVGTSDTATGAGTVEERLMGSLDPKVASVYQQVGAYMEKYRSGKIPKAFKVIPSLKGWEEVLWLTNPPKWSPAAVCYATRLFAHACKPKMAQRFFNLVLFPRVMEDIDEHRKLNYHLYQAIKRAIYRPAAFFKGIVLPMAEEGCSLRQAVIMASVLHKCSIPVLHSSVALLKLAQLPYSAATTLFMKTLLSKKYALPYKVVNTLVDYFASFVEDDRPLPVVWHQSLLVFVQRYKRDLLDEQRERLKTVMRAHHHHQITPEVRRELFATAAGAGADVAMKIT